MPPRPNVIQSNEHLHNCDCIWMFKRRKCERKPTVCNNKKKVTDQTIDAETDFFLVLGGFSIGIWLPCGFFCFFVKFCNSIGEKMALKRLNHQCTLLLGEESSYSSENEAHLHCLLKVIGIDESVKGGWKNQLFNYLINYYNVYNKECFFLKKKKSRIPFRVLVLRISMTVFMSFQQLYTIYIKWFWNVIRSQVKKNYSINTIKSFDSMHLNFWEKFILGPFGKAVELVEKMILVLRERKNVLNRIELLPILTDILLRSGVRLEHSLNLIQIVSFGISINTYDSYLKHVIKFCVDMLCNETDEVSIRIFLRF